MEEVPTWIIKVIEVEQLGCRGCNRRFLVDDLVSIGIQESSKVSHKDILYIGLFCAKCKELIIFELKEMSLLQFAFEILEQETDDRVKKIDKRYPPSRKDGVIRRKRKKVNKSKITLKELKENVKFLQKIETHEEFMLAMGMSLEELRQYDFKRKKPEK